MIHIIGRCGGFLAALVTALGLTSTAYSQTGSVVGTVVDSETGETLRGANVVIDGTSTGSTTDLDGKYAIRNVEPGSYELIFSYIG